ncbi:hypothetical protein CANCADRAFT_29886 [Tortispora caseinolytica NRRL Y-17796]|uniref:Zn(2)-C6 fungal-type domain-containing protein n=1 Tax=Tortispora caseinolytica NRRL Y-17796 TaxID=767744 RepID=A0A1E4TI72_9ASCO|nr:hypothetical protein CANCADRAFT_29886 [Tortispora caseinolytica NRRL Y-17796]
MSKQKNLSTTTTLPFSVMAFAPLAEMSPDPESRTSLHPPNVANKQSADLTTTAPDVDAAVPADPVFIDSSASLMAASDNKKQTSQKRSKKSGKAPASVGKPPASSKRQVQRTRTRTGCITCRRRKKKCDEGKPECMNCKSNNLICEGYTPKSLWKPQDAVPKGEGKEPLNQIGWHGLPMPLSMSPMPGSNTPLTELPSASLGLPMLTDSVNADVLRPANFTVTLENEVDAETGDHVVVSISSTNPDAIRRYSEKFNTVSRLICPRNPRNSSHLLTGYQIPSVIAGIETPLHRRLLQYYINNSSRHFTLMAEDDKNPFLTVILPIAMKHEMLMHSLLHLSAGVLREQLGPNHPEFEEVSKENAKQQQIAMEMTTSMLSSMELAVRDETVASVLLFVALTLFAGDTQGNTFRHIEGVRRLLIAREALRHSDTIDPRNIDGMEFDSGNPMPSSSDLFFYDFWLYCNVMSGMSWKAHSSKNIPRSGTFYNTMASLRARKGAESCSSSYESQTCSSTTGLDLSPMDVMLGTSNQGHTSNEGHNYLDDSEVAAIDDIYAPLLNASPLLDSNKWAASEHLHDMMHEEALQTGSPTASSVSTASGRQPSHDAESASTHSLFGTTTTRRGSSASIVTSASSSSSSRPAEPPAPLRQQTVSSAASLATSFTGVGGDLFELINDVCRLYVDVVGQAEKNYQVFGGERPDSFPPDAILRAIELEGKLAAWEPIPPEDGSQMDWRLVLLADVHRLCAHICLHRILYYKDGLANPRTRATVTAAIDIFKRLPLYCQTETFLIFPLFAIGCSTIDSAERMFIIDRFEHVRNWCGYANIKYGLEIMKECWRRWDQNEDGWEWQSVVESKGWSIMIA